MHLPAGHVTHERVLLEGFGAMAVFKLRAKPSTIGWNSFRFF